MRSDIIERPDADFYPGMHHRNFVPVPDSERIPVASADEIDRAISAQLERLRGRKAGIMLSGGMDSAIVASYMRGCDAYTFRFLGGEYGREELERAEYYAGYYGLELHYVDITWDTVERGLDICMRAKCAPVHSIEPQIYQAAMQAKADGIGIMLVGESSDLVFGGMDRLLSRDWDFDGFMKRYIFTDPEKVLVDPVPVRDVFERYRRDGDGIDFLSFMDDIFSVESSGSYMNAFACAGMDYYDPYARLKMSVPLRPLPCQTRRAEISDKGTDEKEVPGDTGAGKGPYAEAGGQLLCRLEGSGTGRSSGTILTFRRSAATRSGSCTALRDFLISTRGKQYELIRKQDPYDNWRDRFFWECGAQPVPFHRHR